MTTIIGPIDKLNWRTLIDLRQSIKWMKENRPVVMKDLISLEEEMYKELFSKFVKN